MDLGGWNFDSSLLNSMHWVDNADTNSRCSSDTPRENKTRDNKRTTVSASISSRASPTQLDTSNWDGNLALLSNFGGIEYEGGQPLQKASDTASHETRDSISQSDRVRATQLDVVKAARNGDAGWSAGPMAISETSSMASGKKGGGASSAASQAPSGTSSLSQSTGGPQLHPMAIQSFATCPPHGSGSGSTNSGEAQRTSAQQNPYSQLSSTGLVSGQHQPPPNLFGLHGVDGAAMASMATSYQYPPVASNTQAKSGAGNSHMNSLAANFMLAQSYTDTNVSPPTARVHAAPAPTQTNTSKGNKKSKSKKSRSSSRQQRQSQRNGSGSSNTGGANKPPPFYLFDAPVELRANFMQNQRKLGLPIQHDPNSYHYGETVKGFHPQQLLNQQQAGVLSTNGQPHQVHEVPVQLIDARHGNIRANMTGRVKNEREQKRAQKITELIEELRINMENGGWKVEMRSKFHTLSQCAEYVKHMINETKEKEDNVNKLKSALEIEQRKIEDKASQESRSDPESVTSSLTSDTSRVGYSKPDLDSDAKRKAISAEVMANKRRDTGSSRNMSSISMTEDSSGGGEDRDGAGSGTASGSDPGADSSSFGKTALSGVSDLTDSNQATSSNNSGCGGSGTGNAEIVTSRMSLDEDDKRQQSSGSISSDAAVVSEKSSCDGTPRYHHNHKDVVFNTEKRSERKRAPKEVNSRERGFELDYEEVFSMSNLPQIIATTSGKIVSWNRCFLKATGLRKREVQRMTIFSLVKPDKLSNFFEIVAHALKDEEEQILNDVASDVTTRLDDKTEAVVSPDEKSKNEALMDTSDRPADYAAMTLPCVEFPGMKKRREKNVAIKHADPLHVTVTLMNDKDPRKRCFHCVFTNCPGTNGALGIITPDLLAALFASPSQTSKRPKRHHHSHRHKHKRSRNEISDQEAPVSMEVGQPNYQELENEGINEEQMAPDKSVLEKEEQAPLHEIQDEQMSAVELSG